ncbi:MAG: hypothetical protein AAF694_18415 [Bacteroidota bacterium]
MQVEIEHLQALLRAATQKANTNLSRAGMGILSEKINSQIRGIEITQRYLDETVRRGIVKALNANQKFLQLEAAYIHAITQYLGYIDLDDFLKKSSSQAPQQLVACIGSWYNYVRESSGRDVILRSPVKIYPKRNEIFMEMKGYHRTFEAKVTMRSGCISCLLEDQQKEKELHLVYRIGIALYPQVLQGVFSGISTNELPIAGREILIRQEGIPYQDLSPEKIVLSQKELDMTDLESSVINQLKDFNSNYLIVSSSMSFDLGDLE